MGELKNNSPTLFIDFESVYETRYSPHLSDAAGARLEAMIGRLGDRRSTGCCWRSRIGPAAVVRA